MLRATPLRPGSEQDSVISAGAMMGTEWRTARMRMALVICLAVSALIGCGREPRPLGEPGGVPVRFSVDFSSAYLHGMSRPSTYSSMFIEPPFGYAYPYGDSRYRYFGRGYARGGWIYRDPFWDEPQFTDLYLLGGDAPAEAGIFRTALRGGHSEFDVFIRPGREVTLTTTARGGREGWEAVGHFTVADRPGQVVQLSLTAEGPRMAVTPAPEVVAQPSIGEAALSATSPAQ
jgi:hypothetical protein